jgi:hypothetical protein
MSLCKMNTKAVLLILSLITVGLAIAGMATGSDDMDGLKLLWKRTHKYLVSYLLLGLSSVLYVATLNPRDATSLQN